MGRHGSSTSTPGSRPTATSPRAPTPHCLPEPRSSPNPQKYLAKAQELAAAYGDVPNLHMGTIKVFMDGVIEYPAQTAALLKPYLDADGNPTSNYGDLYATPQRSVSSSACSTRPAGRCTRTPSATPPFALPSTDMRSPARPTATSASVTPSPTYSSCTRMTTADSPSSTSSRTMQLQWATRNVWTMDALLPFIGPRSVTHACTRPQSMLSAGAPLAGGSDWPVDPLYPWNQVQTAIDRIRPVRRGRAARHPRGHLTSSSHCACTPAAPRTSCTRRRRPGRVEVGKQADLVMLDQDITTCPVSDIKDSVPQLTMVGGAVTFDLATTSGRATRRSLESTAASKKLLGRVRHDHFGGRHEGCPCTAGGGTG